jgi:hypothetical protein
VAAARRSTGALTRAPRAAQPTRYHPGPNEPEPRRSGREGPDGRRPPALRPCPPCMRRRRPGYQTNPSCGRSSTRRRRAERRPDSGSTALRCRTNPRPSTVLPEQILEPLSAWANPRLRRSAADRQPDVYH